MTPEQAREWLEYSPKDPGPIAPGLLGFVDDAANFYCSTCTGRLGRRGIVLTRMTPIWDRTDKPCAACGGKPAAKLI